MAVMVTKRLDRTERPKTNIYVYTKIPSKVVQISKNILDNDLDSSPDTLIFYVSQNYFFLFLVWNNIL